ncbi:hypothetical protein BaRGS_00009871 [Batillaria attramentaria]|uniref:Uncharacterized protein n=1 Tax=Batillaria attramentaria TaxID=370345 RepID=A0ABD0LGR4_9CAEN
MRLSKPASIVQCAELNEVELRIKMDLNGKAPARLKLYLSILTQSAIKSCGVLDGRSRNCSRKINVATGSDGYIQPECTDILSGYPLIVSHFRCSHQGEFKRQPRAGGAEFMASQNPRRSDW